MVAVLLALIAAGGAVMAAWISARQGKKITETHKQVTINSHSSENPTVLDVIADVREDIKEVKAQVEDLKAHGTTGLVRHLEWHLREDNK